MDWIQPYIKPCLYVRHLCNDNCWGMLLISLNFLHSPSTFSVCSIVSNNVKKMYNVWRTTVILIVTMYTEFVLYYADCVE